MRDTALVRARHHAAVGASVGALLLSLGSTVLGAGEAPVAIAGFRSQNVAPGVWRVLDDGAGDALLGRLSEVATGPGGSVWVLSGEGAFELGVGGLGPGDQDVDRLFAVDADDAAWLRYLAADREGFGTWDGRAWTDVSGPRRPSAFASSATGAPGVIRDLALGNDGSVWVVAGEQDGPRWQRFTIERLDEDGWTSWAIGEGLPDVSCGKNCGDGSRVLALDDGSVWASVDQGGLLRFDGLEWQAVRPLGGDEDHPVHVLAGDRDGVMWAEVEGPDGDVAVRFDGTAWHLAEHALPDRQPVGAARAVGPDGTLWLEGRSEDGAAVVRAIDEQRRRLVADLGSCPDEQQGEGRRCVDVSSIAVGPDGLVWVVASARDRAFGRAGDGALLVVDPETALDA